MSKTAKCKFFSGIYLWEHILQGEVKPVKDLLYSHGEKIIGDVRYRYVMLHDSLYNNPQCFSVSLANPVILFPDLD